MLFSMIEMVDRLGTYVLWLCRIFDRMGAVAGVDRWQLSRQVQGERVTPPTRLHRAAPAAARGRS